MFFRRTSDLRVCAKKATKPCDCKKARFCFGFRFFCDMTGCSAMRISKIRATCKEMRAALRDLTENHENVTAKLAEKLYRRI